MKKLLLLIIVSFVLAGVASAATVWDPAANPVPIVPPATGNWAETLNWTNGIPTSDLNVAGGETGKAVTNVADAAVCWVTGDQVHGQLVMGDGGPGGLIHLAAGATLTSTSTSSWNAVGYNTPAHMIIERGAVWDCTTDHFWLGMQPGSEGSTLRINGGTLTNYDGAFQLARQDDGASGSVISGQDGGVHGGIDVSLDAGLIDVLRFAGSNLICGIYSTLDISFGTFIVHRTSNSVQNNIADEIAKGYVTAFGEQGDDLIGAELVVTQPGGGITMITATGDPLARTPTMDAYVAWDPTLTWVNLDAIPPATQVWVDVRFGTDSAYDPNQDAYADFAKVVDAGLDTTTAGIGDGVVTPDNGEYVWQVVTYLNGNPATTVYGGDFNDPNAVFADEGILMAFFATDDFPPLVAIDTPPTATWKDVSIALTATVNNDDTSALNRIDWSSDEDPNATFSNEQYSEIPDPNKPGYIIGTATADVTVNYNSGAFNVTLTVADSNPITIADPNISATRELDCRQDACGATRNGVGLAGDYPADIAVDCEHELADFALIARDWLTDYALKEPTEMP